MVLVLGAGDRPGPDAPPSSGVRGGRRRVREGAPPRPCGAAECPRGPVVEFRADTPTIILAAAGDDV
ncbi:hypothetical protein CEP50_15970 [Actinopolyspora mortivallis]|uniref:Uncharacterized protein n=1 Tax=Actinopolyspora mortivallis TaxID=33906 RepID=A0A2T0GTF0_ACTMO|nr:hypothetical protein CEP50_15970 [Actinopolyspora mortivallis]